MSLFRGPCCGVLPRYCAHQPASGGDTGRAPPRLERLSAKEAVSASSGEVTRNGEDVVGGCMQGQESLGRSGRLEPLQFPLSSPHGQMRAFRWVVGALAPGMSLPVQLERAKGSP